MRVASLGAGRMGRGVAVVFAYAGHDVAVVDFKERPQADFDRIAHDAAAEIEGIFHTLARIGLMDDSDAGVLMQRVRIVPAHNAAEAFGAALWRATGDEAHNSQHLDASTPPSREETP